MKKILILSFVMVFMIINFKEVNADVYLPDVYTQTLDTKIDGNNHLYPISVNDLYGFIDVNGKFVIKPKFVWYKKIKEGYYVAYTRNVSISNENTTALNAINGTYLILPDSKTKKISDKYIDISSLNSKRYAAIYDSGMAKEIYDFKSMKIIDDKESSHLIIDLFDNRYVIMDLNDNLYYLKNYDNQKLSTGFENYIGCKDNTFFFQSKNTYYWVDENGKLLFEYKNCKDAFPFINNVTAIVDKAGDLKFVDKDKNILKTIKGVSEVINKDNVYIIYIDENLYENPLMLDFKGNKKLADDYSGEIVFSKYSRDFIAAYDIETSIFDVFDKNGNVEKSYEIPKGYTKPYLVKNYIALQEKEGIGLCEIIDGKVNWLVEPYYDDIHYEKDGYILLYSSGLFGWDYGRGLYNLSTKKVILNIDYRFIEVYDKNMIFVRSDQYEGYVNSKGQFVYVQAN